MKTIIKLSLALTLSTLFFLGACESSGITDHQSEVPVERHAEFEETLHAVFENVGNRIQREGVRSDGVKDLFRSAYLEVLGEEATPDAFEAGLHSVNLFRSKQSEAPLVAGLVSAAETPEEALDMIAEALKADDLIEDTIIELVAMRQFILFLDDYNEYFVADDAVPHQFGEFITEGESGWWDSWGKCAAAITGGAGLGGIAGCTAGALFGPKGCAVGGIIGVVSGALYGAAEHC